MSGNVDVSEIDTFVFQSLFSWNLLLMLFKFYIFHDPPQVSILVFVELALDAWLFGAGSRPIVRFQSLFSWNLLLMTISRSSVAW